MSHITLAQQGLAAVEKRDFPTAIQKLTIALKSSNNPAWYIALSKAHIATSCYKEARKDAELAYISARDRNNRELMMEAHYRRAVAHNRLGEYANADCCCMYAMRLAKGLPAVEKVDPKYATMDNEGFWTQTLQDVKNEIADDEFNVSSQGKGAGLAALQPSVEKIQKWRLAGTMRCQALGMMESLPEGHVGRKITVQAEPTPLELSDDPTSAAAPPEASKASSPAIEKPGHESYQALTTMVVTVFSKKINREELKVEFLPKTVRLSAIPYPDGKEREYILHLPKEIDPSHSKYSVTPNKIEITLGKKDSGKWLEGIMSEAGSEPSQQQPPLRTAANIQSESSSQPGPSTSAAPVVVAAATTDTEAPKAEEPKPAASAGPSYPTSSRTGPKNWDTLDLGDEPDEDSDVNAFFKKLYKGATPEQQRAMMKSFTESGGTSLSTNWEDVKDKTVDPVPPAGVEAKKW